MKRIFSEYLKPYSAVLLGTTLMTCLTLTCLILTSLTLTSCGGGGGGSGGGALETGFNSRLGNLYEEVGLIEVQGNIITRNNPSVNDAGEEVYTEVRYFNPRNSMIAGNYDSDGDGIKDTPINDFSSLANAANRLLDFDLAACIKKAGNDPTDKHQGYLNSMVWQDAWAVIPGLDSDTDTTRYQYQYPDTMPASAVTTGTHFVQLILPFKIDRSSLFDLTQANPDQVDYLNSTNVTITDSANLPAPGNHVPCLVLVDGLDVDGTNHVGAANLPDGINFSPGGNKTSIVFLAQASAGQKFVPIVNQPFTTWAAGEEIYIHLKNVLNNSGGLVNVNSRWMIKRDSLAPKDIAVAQENGVVQIVATDPVRYADNNMIIYDYVDPSNLLSGRTVPLISNSSSFILNFTKPVIPETVGQSIVFKGAPFNGNIKPVASSLALSPPLPSQNPCEDSGIYRDPIAPNVVVLSKLILEDGSDTNIQGAIPFRCYPVHQNNLCSYILNPVIDLPGSFGLPGGPYTENMVDPNDQDGMNPPFASSSITRMRIEVQVFIHDANSFSGRPTAMQPASVWPLSAYPPVNMGVTGFFGQSGEIMTTGASRVFTVAGGKRYVNAPVCPQALYYSMGPGGLGVVDLDGNGFTTNDPNFSRAMLVTSQEFYSRFGNAGLGIGNNYSYAGQATTPDGGGTPTFVGLGSHTPMPGINEGSTGIDEVVRDSNGNARLFPDPTSNTITFNITDVEVGDFLDTIYYDKENPWTNKAYHLSPTNLLAQGNYSNNIISTPPTPNPPPLNIPVGMQATNVLLDNFNMLNEGAFVIMGKEVFTMDIPSLLNTDLPPPDPANPPVPPLNVPIRAKRTGFIHLNPAAIAQSPTDEPFPPNPSDWLVNQNPMFPTQPTNIVQGTLDYMNTGPVAESSTIGVGWFYGCRQQIGNFLFVTDKSNNVVNVLNSNTMEIITSLNGLAAPDSAAVTSDLRTLYVSNSGGQSVSAFNVDPRSDNFLDTIATIWVGSQPRGVHCHPEGEDVFVCNYGSSTISVINPKTNTVRKTLSALLNKPWDMVTGPRQTLFGFGTQVYHGYISNYGGDNMLIFESGPDGLGGVGYDDVLDAVPAIGENGQAFLPMQSPRGICWDPVAGTQYAYSGGCYVAHRAGSEACVSKVEFTGQQAPYGPIFLIPNAGAVGGTPGFGHRVFVITAQWGGSTTPLSGAAAMDVALLDYNRTAWINDNWLGNFDVTNLGDLSGPQAFLPLNNKNVLRLVQGAYRQTVNSDRIYVSYENTPVIDVLDIKTNQILKTITGLPRGARTLKTFFKN